MAAGRDNRFRSTHCRPNAYWVVEVAERLKAAVCIRSPGSLIGVGCRLANLGPGLGTLAGTLKPTPTCAYQAHIVIP
jgi:hypothetical protein